MKIKKLISIIMTMNNNHLDTLSHEEATEAFLQSVNKMYDTIISLQEKLNGQIEDIPDDETIGSADRHNIEIKIRDEYGSNTYGQVKIFPVLIDEDVSEPPHFNHRIDYTLACTDNSGRVTIELPKYIRTGYHYGLSEIKQVKGFFIEVSKGSEYSILNQYFDIISLESGPLLFQLERITDLSKRSWYAGDLHHHSIYSSPAYGGTDDVTESAAEVKNNMASAGLAFGALSDHHNILNHQDWRMTKNKDFLPIISKEISTSNGHVMALNVKEDVIYQIPKAKERTQDYLLKEFIRITTQIRENGGLAQINHPRDMNPAISLSSYMTEHIDLFDTLEIWNGSIPMMNGTTNDQAYKLWLNLLKNNIFIPATTGSDTHNTRANDYHNLYNHLNYFIFNLKKGINLPGISKSHLKEASRLIEMFESSSKLFEKWAKENLGTGGVRTYIHLKNNGKLSEKEVLEALKEGSSFLTNGPLLLPSINGLSLGESVNILTNMKKVNVSIEIIANKPVTDLLLESKRGTIKRVSLQKPFGEETTKKILLDIELEGSLFEKKDWIIFRALSDHTNQVITNPIFINKE